MTRRGFKVEVVKYKDGHKYALPDVCEIINLVSRDLAMRVSIVSNSLE